MKETKEAHLRRTEEYRETALQINGTGNEDDGVDRLINSRTFNYPGGVKGAGCKKIDATSRSAVSSVMSSLKS